MQKTVDVFRTGESVEGAITQVEKNVYVEVSGRHPWVIRYQFLIEGLLYER
jgi:hypothetical protein